MNPSELLGALLECLPDAAVAADNRGRILHFNSSATRLLGWSASEAMERLRTPDLYADLADARAVMVRLRQRTAGLPGAAEPMSVDLRTRGGARVPVRLTASWVRGPSGPAGTVGVFADRRPLQGIEDRLQAATELVADRERRVEATNIGPRMASELAQPMTAALAHLDIVVERGGLPEAAEDRVMQALEQLERVRGIVHELTRLSTHWKAPL